MVTGRPAIAAGAVVCRQCGESTGVTVLRHRSRRIRYWCARCGAVDTVDRRTPGTPPVAIRPPASRPDLTTAPAVGPDSPAVPAGAPDPAEATGSLNPATAPGDLLDVMPADMVAWVAGRSGGRSAAARLDKSVTYQLYQLWDRHRGSHGDDRTGPLPAFATVVGAVHAACYHTDVAVAQLCATAPIGTDTDALRERAGHARAWLARHPEMCWIVTDDPVVPERAAVEAAAEALRAGQEPDQAGGWATRAALFGVAGGPTLRRLRDAYPAGEMLAALAIYLESGRRPLRDDVLAHLAGPATDPGHGTPAGAADRTDPGTAAGPGHHAATGTGHGTARVAS